MPEQDTAPRYLVETAWLQDHLGDPDLRILDCTVYLPNYFDESAQKKVEIVPGLQDYTRSHIPGSVYVDLVGELTDKSNKKFMFPMPSADQFASVMSREMQDFDSAIRVNLEGTGMSHEMRFPEGIASSHIHLAGVHITLGDLDRAREHLGKARLLLDNDPWFWWVYENRYRYELGRYWIAQGDLVQARNAVGKLLDLANRTLKNKHIALGHMLRAEIGVLEDNREVAQVDYDKALDLVDRYPCPTIEWQIARASATNCQRLHDSERASELLARGRAVTQRLAESIADARLRKTFLSSEAVRNLR